MTPLAVEIATVASPLVGAGAVLFFMRRDRAMLDKMLADVSARLKRIEANQHKFELALKDFATWDAWRELENSVDNIRERLGILEDRCNREHNGEKS